MYKCTFYMVIEDFSIYITNIYTSIPLFILPVQSYHPPTGALLRGFGSYASYIDCNASDTKCIDCNALDWD